MQEWFLIRDGERRGPFSLQELADQQLRRNTLVWREGMMDWVTVADVPELLQLLSPVPPRAAAPPPVPQRTPSPAPERPSTALVNPAAPGASEKAPAGGQSPGGISGARVALSFLICVAVAGAMGWVARGYFVPRAVEPGPMQGGGLPLGTVAAPPHQSMTTPESPASSPNGSVPSFEPGGAGSSASGASPVGASSADDAQPSSPSPDPPNWKQFRDTAAYFLSTVAHRDRSIDLCAPVTDGGGGDLSGIEPVRLYDEAQLEAHPRYVLDIDHSGEALTIFGSTDARWSGGNCSDCEWVTTFIFYGSDPKSLAYLSLDGLWKWRIDGTDVVAAPESVGVAPRRYVLNLTTRQYELAQSAAAIRPGVGDVQGQAWHVPMAITAGMVPPELIKRVEPDMPLLAKRRGAQGDVVLSCVIDEQGSVAVDKVLTPVDGLTEAASEAVRLWKYKPAQLEGHPQAVFLTVTVSFRL